MLTYFFQCSQCGHEFEVLKIKGTGEPDGICPKCRETQVTLVGQFTHPWEEGKGTCPCCG